MLDGVRWEMVALGLWIAGFVTIMARLLVGMLAVQWMSRRTEVVDRRLVAAARAAAGRGSRRVAPRHVPPEPSRDDADGVGNL